MDTNSATIPHLTDGKVEAQRNITMLRTYRQYVRKKKTVTVLRGWTTCPKQFVPVTVGPARSTLWALPNDSLLQDASSRVFSLCVER